MVAWLVWDVAISSKLGSHKISLMFCVSNTANANPYFFYKSVVYRHFGCCTFLALYWPYDVQVNFETTVEMSSKILVFLIDRSELITHWRRIPVRVGFTEFDHSLSNGGLVDKKFFFFEFARCIELLTTAHTLIQKQHTPLDIGHFLPKP